jgi:S1-C subfamily serine protease
MYEGVPQPPRASRPLAPLITAIIVGVVCGVLVMRFLGWNSGPPPEPRTVTPRGDLADSEKTTIELFENASPSVVYITNVALRRYLFRLDVMEIPQGTGSGFIWDSAGHIVTNYHVIHNADALEVTLSDQSVYKAGVVGAEPDKDLAVLKINAPISKLRPIPIGTSADLKVGQSVFAIGNPFGLDHTLTRGIVSAIGRSIQSMTGRTIEGVIQTDAAINPGNSGGPLLDSAGRLIGINTAIFSPSGSSAGIGFAVPVDTINRVVPQLIAHGKVIRPRLGVTLLDRRVNDSIVKDLGMKGVVIGGVEDNSGAAAAGLRGVRTTREGSVVIGDIIQKIDDRTVNSVDDLLDALEKKKVGQTVKVTVLRDNQTRTVDVVLQ